MHKGMLSTVALLFSLVLGVGAIALGQQMIVVAIAALLPWVPFCLFWLRAEFSKYQWLAFFELLVILQLGHFIEHVTQIVQLHLLEWPPFLARGIVGELDIEPVHFWWNTIVLLAATLLLVRYARNYWLWGSWLFSVWHELEHVYLYFFWFLQRGISGHPGILGAGGILDEANLTLPVLTTLGRAELHFWYNLFEIGLFVIAFAVQALRTIHPQSAPRLTRRHILGATIAAQIALILFVGLLRHSPATLRVPMNYSTIQSAIDAAPPWAIIRLAPGVYTEAVRIHKPLMLIGSGREQTILRVNNDEQTALTVSNTHHVVVKNLAVEGGFYGILVDRSTEVQLVNNAVRHAWFVGIRVSEGAAVIERNEVSATRSPFGMGIELANTMFAPPSVVRENLVTDHAQEGIVLHNSHGLIDRNTVMRNRLRGIAVTEMSMATVRDNTIVDNADAGIYVVDESVAEIHGNRVRKVTAGPWGEPHGIRAYYYAEVTLGANEIELDPRRAVFAGHGATVLAARP